MEADDISRTLHCLRGRLLAERHASNVAKHQAQLMAIKLIEIENQLMEETKLRRKAEKKLRFLMKKLDSFNFSFTLEAKPEEHLLSSAEICGFYFTSSSSPSGSINSAFKPRDIKQGFNDSLSDKSGHHHHASPSCQSSKNDFQSSEAAVDDSSALVAVDLPAPINEKREVMIANNGVNEVLDALKHAREKIQGSIARRRRMIEIGPP